MSGISPRVVKRNAVSFSLFRRKRLHYSRDTPRIDAQTAAGSICLGLKAVAIDYSNTMSHEGTRSVRQRATASGGPIWLHSSSLCQLSLSIPRMDGFALLSGTFISGHCPALPVCGKHTKAKKKKKRQLSAHVSFNATPTQVRRWRYQARPADGGINMADMLSRVLACVLLMYRLCEHARDCAQTGRQLQLSNCGR